MRKRTLRKKRNNKKRNNRKTKRSRKKKRKKRSYKLMKGGSMAGNFFRFLAGENDKDKFRASELKELNEYKKQQAEENRLEQKEEIDSNNEKLQREQNEELEQYKKSKEVIDSDNIDVIDKINNLDKGMTENNNLNVLKGGGMLADIMKVENTNFNKWFSGSTNAYKDVVKRMDPYGIENKNWKREIVNGNPLHLEDNSTKKQNSNETFVDQCPQSGGKRRRRRRKRRTNKKKSQKKKYSKKKK